MSTSSHPADGFRHQPLEDHPLPVDWEPYYGENSHQFPCSTWKDKGAVSFIRHLGKPLTAELWHDLRKRLQIRQLQIFYPGFLLLNVPDMVAAPAARIFIDSSGLVLNIEYY